MLSRKFGFIANTALQQQERRAVVPVVGRAGSPFSPTPPFLQSVLLHRLDSGFVSECDRSSEPDPSIQCRSSKLSGPLGLSAYMDPYDTLVMMHAKPC